MPPKKEIKPKPKPKTSPIKVSTNDKKNITSSKSQSSSDKVRKVKTWTKDDDNAVIIQKYIRRFLAKKLLLRIKKVKEKIDIKENYENEMEELEKRAFLEIVKRQQLENERQRKIEEEEKRRIREFNKRKKDMLEASFDGNMTGILSVLQQVENDDDKNGIKRDFIGQNIRKHHILDMVICEDANKNTPISEAASGGHPGIVQFLIDKGAYINCRGQFKRTPLYRAAFAGNLDVCDVLLRNGADPKLYADDAQTPLNVASTEAVKEFLENWNYADTERLLKKIDITKAKLVEENKKRIEAEINNIDAQIVIVEKDYDNAQKRLNKAYCEMNKRIYEHDRAVCKGFDKIDITEKVIHDAEFEVESARMHFEEAREKLALLKLRRREKQKEDGVASGEENIKPGIECHIKELEDVLFKDVGNRLESSGKWPIVIDPSGQAATFLRYRDTNYCNALNLQHMEREKLRIALLGAIRFGKPFVLDLMEIIESYESCELRFSEIQPQLMLDVINKSILTPTKYTKLLRSTDDPEYDKNKFNEFKIKKFKFVVITSNSLPTDSLLQMFQPVWIHIG